MSSLDQGPRIDPQRVRRLVRRWGLLIVAMSVVGAGAGFVVSQMITPVYRAEGTLLVLASPQQQGQSSGVNLSAGQVTSTYAALITARPLLERVIGELKLATRPQDLVKRLGAKPDRDAEIIQVDATDTSPERAAGIVNTLMTDFVADVSDRNQRRIDRAGSAIKEQINQIEQDLADSEQKLIAAQRAKQDASALTDHIQAQNVLLTQLTTVYSGFSAAQVQNLDNVSVVSTATVPDSPASPRRGVNAALGGVLGLIVSLLVVLGIEYLDQGLRSEEDVRERLGEATLGVIPAYAPPRWRPGGGGRDEHVAEAYRRLRTNLRFAAVDRGISSVVVTSGRRGEGKSCTAANLARAMGAAGQRVILADADLRRPSQHRMFEKPLKSGLSEMLLTGSERVPALNGQHTTEYPNLSVLTSGTIPPNPSELLASSRAARLIEALELQHDVVILDTPPTGAVTDALSLAARASATIVVVEAGRTGARQARQTIQALRAVGANVVGVVLSKAALRRSDGYYHGYQAYHIGSGGDDASDSAEQVAAEEPLDIAWKPIGPGRWPPPA